MALTDVSPRWVGDTWWLQLHRALVLIGLIGAVAGAALGAGLQEYDYHPQGAGAAHKALGIVAVAAVSVQAIGPLIWRPLKGHKHRAAWDVGHHWLGRLAFALGAAAVFTGIYIAAVGRGYYVVYGATVAGFFVFMAFKDAIDTFMGRKIKSITTHIVQQGEQKEAAVNQTTDTVASHTGDCWSENAGGLYPYLKSSCGSKAKLGPISVSSSVQLAACAGRSHRDTVLTAMANQDSEPPGEMLV